MLDPLGQSQVIPYLRELSKRGIEFTLLSFEREPARKNAEKFKALKASLRADGIDWNWLPYHQTPSLPATTYDVVTGTRYARRLVRSKRIEMVHARSHVPALIALRLKRRYGVKMIFDVRGLLADEYVDANHWRRDSLVYRLTKSTERRLFRASDAIVTLTEKIWPIIKEWDGLRGRDVIHQVVPCCADLDLFNFDAAARAARRRELNLQDRFVLVYSGSIDGWYLTEAMADFFSVFRRARPDAHFLWLAPRGHDRIRSLMRERGIGESDFTVLAAASADVPAYLSAADAGLAFIKSCLSKMASSPTKYAEYLGCGLPLIINEGIGDSDMLVTTEKAGALVRDFTDAEYAAAARTIENFTRDSAATRQHTRAVAKKLFDLERVGGERYAQLYEQLLSSEEEKPAAAPV
jgi:glycosyltransferase involved in cell wall biosynthesis